MSQEQNQLFSQADKRYSQLRNRSTNNGETVADDEEINPNDVLRILVATDNHLGYMERDRVRKHDSFITMQEILEVAKEQKVDFILHGGDLFHENKPSRETLHKTIELFRKYCCGDEPVPLVIHSDQKMNFQSNFGTVNYEDPNFNISLPVFAIHGNHDDPTGENGLSAMDLLSVTNLINYFGKTDNIDDIHIKPVLLSKGNTKVALYGMGWIKDERLYRTFEQKHVKFYRPSQSKDDWFNLFVLHQNRHQHHSKKANISDSMLRGFFDVVIWGHEHEQQVVPTKSAEGNFDVMQPGSSIVTSLSPEESKQKKIAVLEIYKDQYRCVPIDLKTVRPFAMNAISLQDFDELDDERNNPEEIADFLASKVEELIEEANDRLPPTNILQKHPSLKLPLIRLKVDYSGGYASINPQRFGQRFIDKVANPSDLLILSRSKTRKTIKGKASDEPQATKEEIISAIVSGKNVGGDFIAGNTATDGITIDDLVAEFLKQDNGLDMINELQLADAVVDYVEKEETHSINDFIERQIKEVRKRLWKDSKKLLQDNETTTIEEKDIEELVHNYAEQQKATMELRSDKRRANRASKGLEHDEEEEEEAPRKGKNKKKVDSDEEEFESALASVKNERSDEEETTTRGRGKTTTRGRGRGRGAKSTSTRKKKVDSDEDEDDDYEEEEEIKPKKTTRGRAAASSSKSKAAATKKRKASSSDDEVITLDDSDEEAPPPVKRRRATTKKPTFKPL